MPGKGLAQALIISSMEAFKDASPMGKITPYGYTEFLLNNSKPNVLSDTIDDSSGYIRDVKYRYMQRSTLGETTTTDDCAIDTDYAYLEGTVPVLKYRKLGIAFDNGIIQTFEKDALGVMQKGTPATPIMREIWDAVVSKLNGFFGDINLDLLTEQSVNFGNNVTTGNNTAKTINFALDGTQNDLNQGATRIIADAMENESLMGGATIVGSGYVNNYAIQQQAKGFDQSGVNTRLLGLPPVMWDPYSQQAWGTNKFGLFQKDAVQLLNVCMFRGPKAGLLGGDYFFTLKFPVVDSIGQGSYKEYEFDVQMTYRTCVEQVQVGIFDADNNPPITMQRGWNFIFSSHYNQVNIPADSYKTDDRLVGNNGTYLYVATNA